MAHTKAGGAAKRTVDVAGKRLGFKKFGGEFVAPGNIILRQRGTKFHPGTNVMMGRDHTLFAVAEGHVGFRRMTGFKRAKKYVDVLPQSPVKTAVEAAKSLAPVASTKRTSAKTAASRPKPAKRTSKTASK